MLAPAVDGGITLEKELSKTELLAVMELYRTRGATSDVSRLLKLLSQMERYEVRGQGPSDPGQDKVQSWHCGHSQPVPSTHLDSKMPWCFWDGDPGRKVT